VSSELHRNALELAWSAVSIAFGSLGRICLAVSPDFRVRHASGLIDTLLGADASTAIVGRPVEEILGAELFGAGGLLREALSAGERREGWRASLRLEPFGSRPVSISVAPLEHDPDGVCDTESAYLVVIRAVEDTGIGADGPMGYGGLIARSPSMTRVFRLVHNLEHSDATVLLTGESGTGKEVVARAIHATSARRDKPFVAVNCGALPADLLESELFGHVRGAFTGAVRDRVGRFELAGRGTLFLDEIGDLPLPLQVKLLRVLQERTFERVGESTPRACEARIIAATNLDLRRAIAEGTFREDLYYRLRVLPIELPPLRARQEDIEPLARHLLARVGARTGRALRFSPEAVRLLLGYAWPGNVRELENVLEYAVAVCKGQTLQPEDLPDEIRTAKAAPPAEPPLLEERAAILAALEAHRWRREPAARALGMSRSKLWRRMRELGVAR
jgi:DNA-binding NtrC family response regulator